MFLRLQWTVLLEGTRRRRRDSTLREKGYDAGNSDTKRPGELETRTKAYPQRSYRKRRLHQACNVPPDTKVVSKAACTRVDHSCCTAACPAYCVLPKAWSGAGLWSLNHSSIQITHATGLVIEREACGRGQSIPYQQSWLADQVRARHNSPPSAEPSGRATFLSAPCLVQSCCRQACSSRVSRT